MKFSVTKKDFEITWFAKGKGGQYINKHPNCCRLKHKDTGVITIGTEQRHRPQNQKLALKRMSEHPKFRAFCDLKLRELEMGQTIEEWVEDQMSPENLKVEIRDKNGNWIEE